MARGAHPSIFMGQQLSFEDFASEVLCCLQHTVKSHSGHPVTVFRAYGNLETMEKVAPISQALEFAGITFKQTASRRSENFATMLHREHQTIHAAYTS